MLLRNVCTSPVRFTRRDAPFAEVRTNLKQDFSTHKKDNPNHPNKYFHEAIFHTHYDGRFASQALSGKERYSYLAPLVQAYLSTMSDIGVTTFLMHGTLLGWYWNRRIMPWDDDIDVVVTENGIHRLAAGYNMTVHTFFVPSLDQQRAYLLEVNPHCVDPTTDPDNAIDARWIDMESGLFIDITTLRRDWNANALGMDGAMMMKDKHHYMYDDIFPLRGTTFEGVDAKIPFAYTEILVEEYKPNALTRDHFKNYRFDQTKKEWVLLE